MTEERDPYLKSPNTPGAKLDAGKNRLGMVLGGFSDALWDVGLVGTFGADKYSEHGWLYVPDAYDRYTNAMLRHWLDEARGELLDPQTRLLHAAHLAWNALARLQLLKNETGGRDG